MTAAALDAGEGLSLKRRLRRAERGRQVRSMALIAPLFIFIVVTFVVPIGVMLTNSVRDTTIAELMPSTIAALADWNGQDLPDEAAFAAVVADLKVAQKNKTTAAIGKRLNYEISGIRSRIISTGRAVEEMESGPYKEALIEENRIWGDLRTWVVIKRASGTFTDYYVLNAIDLQRDLEGTIVSVSKSQAIYRGVFLRTLGISLTVTLATLALGYPVAYLLASLPLRSSNLLMILVLLPFWTSLLVRTTAWVVLLQGQGVVNSVLQMTGFISEPLDLIYNRFGTIIAMTHIQLPFTLLPIYSVMKTISPSHMRAARSLGAKPWTAFWRVYFPQTVPGIAAGCLLTFILCLGYYITPALVGGPTDQMVSYFVALYTNREINWGMASALGGILLMATVMLYLVYNRLVGVDRVRLG